MEKSPKIRDDSINKPIICLKNINVQNAESVLRRSDSTQDIVIFIIKIKIINFRLSIRLHFNNEYKIKHVLHVGKSYQIVEN